ncbi:hypothetical protein GCM10020367_12740 [Streptomyces sannanensis]|uniref:Uncharacterized protein n=1 Tax=Streptomyces sannanensis TaxID=285536 RepID=A0ABP6S730_9ACTN
MHAYDPLRPPYQIAIPAMRPSLEVTGGHSPTPIYDALYSEYRRALRALPGDRSGEENLKFTGFASAHHSGRGWHLVGYVSGSGNPGHPGDTGHASGSSRNGGRQHPGHHLPAALPPGPRRGL